MSAAGRTLSGTYPLRTGEQLPWAALQPALTRLLAAYEPAFAQTATDLDVTIAPERLRDVVSILKSHPDLAFDYLRNVSGVDFEDQGMALKYHFYSFRYGHALQVTVPTSAGHPHVPSLTSLYPAADWHEREAAEMYGFLFDGHPNLKNLLLEEDLHIHPLLKAHPLQKVEILQGIEDESAGFSF